VATFTLNRRKVKPQESDMTRKESKQDAVKKKRVSSQVSMILLGGAIVILSIFYLAEFNKLATDGVILDQLEAQRKRLITENEDWKSKITQLRSLDVIENQPVIAGMLDVGEVIYVNLDEL
jgi:hypothetical protein